MEKVFESRKEEFQKIADELNAKYQKVALVRILIFVAGIAISIYLLHLKMAAPAFFMITSIFLVFGILVNYHRKVKRKYLHYQLLVRVNEEEIKRLHLKLDAFDQGAEFLEEAHPYAYDLDIFGRHSLFQLINRTGTPKGKALLAKALKQHAHPEDIEENQKAILELRDQLDWRQNFQARAMAEKTSETESDVWIIQWSRKPEFLVQHWAKYIVYLSWGAFLLALSFMLMGKISYYWIFLFNAISALMILPRAKKIEEFANNMVKTNTLLEAYKKLLEDIEQHEFKNAYLSAWQQKLKAKKAQPSLTIKKLSRVVDHLENRKNLYYIIINSFFMLDIFLIGTAEKWKSRHGQNLELWLEAIAEFERLASMAAFSYANPSFSFPKISPKEHHFSAKDTGHPMINKAKCVVNDFVISGKGTVALITGSNMAGKSTFLRTVGLNLVLAQAGCPVYATEFEFSPCDVFTSMRTKDNLEESVSTFYAELLRVNQLIQKLNDKRSTFFLLDEILRGTNSHDRLLGAKALIKQLNRSNAFGLVSSHDVELAQLSAEITNLENHSFHSSIVDHDLLFDYKIRNGVCTNFNAVALMQKMGISISG